MNFADSGSKRLLRSQEVMKPFSCIFIFFPVRYGWINDVRAAFPIQKATSACGNRVDVITTKTQDKNARFHVWCHYN